MNTAMVNPWMYEAEIIRVKDVYGHFYWVSKRHFDLPNKTALHICNGKGLLRTYTKTGADGLNALHRESVAQIGETRITGKGKLS